MEVEAVDEGVARQAPDRGRHRGRQGQHADRRSAADGESADAARRCRRRHLLPPSAASAPAAEAPAAAQPIAGALRQRCSRCRSGRSRLAPKWCTMTVREALRDAMAEEMRRDRDVFVMGEEVAEYQGAYKITQGLLQEFGAKRVDRHPDHRAWLCRSRRRCGDGRPEADRRVHDLQLRHAGDRPHHQLGGQDALHVRRPDGGADRLPRSERRSCPRRRPAQPGLCGLVQPDPGPARSSCPIRQPTPRAC